MKILDLVKILAHDVTREPDGLMDPIEDVTEDLAVIHGPYSPRGARAGWVYDGKLPLSPITPELDLEGPLFLFQYIGHEPVWYLFTYQSLAEVEASILDRCGYLNLFTSGIVIIHNNVVLPFRVFVRDASGRERLFEKSRQIDEDDFGTEYLNPRIEWLPAYHPDA